MNRRLRTFLLTVSVSCNILFAALLVTVAIPEGRDFLRQRFHGSPSEAMETLRYRRQVEFFASCPTVTGGVVVAGDSQAAALMTDTAVHYFAGDLNAAWSALISANRLRDRAVYGDTVAGLLARLSDIVRLQPDRLVLHIGINDLLDQRRNEDVLRDYRAILSRLRSDLPNCHTIVTLLPPVNNSARRRCSNDTIVDFNRGLSALASEQQATVVDLYAVTPKMPDGSLAPTVTEDGIHMSGDGLVIWRRALLPAVTGDER